MSRNLAKRECSRCESKVAICGPIYRLPRDHFACPDMLVADADCTVCQAHYTAWLGPTHDRIGTREHDLENVRCFGFYDLSYRASFNDEPGKGDLPDVGKIETARVVTINGRVVSWELME